MQKLKIAFIGGGNMAEALAAGLIRAGHDAVSITVTDLRQDRLDALHAQYGVTTGNDNAAAAAAADVVILAVKPQQMKAVLQGLAGSMNSDATLISIAAGVGSANMREWLGSAGVPLVRVMPNTPALVGAGMSVLFSDADDAHRARAEYVMAASGETAWVENEPMLHAVTAVSGSGPAYFFLLAEMMQAAGESLGLPRELAAKLVAQTATGAGRMLAESGRTPAELRTQVTSPGGTTQAALDMMYENGLPDAVRKGIVAANRRSIELN